MDVRHERGGVSAGDGKLGAWFDAILWNFRQAYDAYSEPSFAETVVLRGNVSQAHELIEGEIRGPR